MDEYRNLDLIVIEDIPEILELEITRAEESKLKVRGFLTGSGAYRVLDQLPKNEMPRAILSDINLGDDFERLFPRLIYEFLFQMGIEDRLRYFTGTYSEYDAELEEKTGRRVYMKGVDGKLISEWYRELSRTKS